MSRRHSGNYRAKHPADIKVDDVITEKVSLSLKNGCITCQDAHSIAALLGIAPIQVGVAIDLQNGRINACQLGLFGYGDIKIIAQAGPQLKPELKSAIQNSLIEGRLSCAAAWLIADTGGLARMEVGRACESLGIKINKCQLGAF